MNLSIERLKWIITKVNTSYELNDEEKEKARSCILRYIDHDAPTPKGHARNGREVEAWCQLAGGGSFMPVGISPRSVT